MRSSAVSAPAALERTEIMISTASALSAPVGEAAALALKAPGSGAEQVPVGASTGSDARIQQSVAPRVKFDPVKVQENLKAAIDDLNKQLSQSGRSLGFSMDDVLNTPVVKVHNTATGEVIRQIPSEAVIRVAHTLDRLKGLLYDSST